MALRIRHKAAQLTSRLRHAWIVLREGTWPAISDDIDADSHLYTRLSARGTKDLEPWTRERMLKMVYYLWVQNPMARSIIETKKDYCVGDGLNYEAKEEDVQKVLDGHWNDPVNDWDKRIHRVPRELLLWGEQIMPAAVQEHTGRVRLGSIDPDNVKDVLVDPLNVELPIGVVLRPGVAQKEIKLQTILLDIEEDDLSEPARKERAKFTDGICFYFAINKLSNSPRGLSDIIQVVDIIDMYDECQFTRGEKLKISGNYFFDCTLEGYSPDQVSAFRKQHEGQLPDPGGTNYHNEKVKWDVIAPDLKAQDFTEDMRRMKNYILGGVRLPEWFFAEGGEVNYATALAMGAPVNKAMRSFQGELESIMRTIFRFQVLMAKKFGRLQENIDEDYKTFGFPEIDTKDLKNLATALQQSVQALSQARMDNAITDDEYRDALRVMLSPFGVELTEKDIQEELQDAQDRLDREPYEAPAILARR